MRFLACGADGILVELADLDETLRVFAALRDAVKQFAGRTVGRFGKPACGAASESTSGMVPESALVGVRQIIPAARTIYVSFNPMFASRAGIVSAIRSLNIADDVEEHSRIVEIPVIYDGEDLTDVADLLGVSVDEVVRRHCDSSWSVAFVGFAPGFAYLTGGDSIFDVPRRKVPRLSVPAGAVGLAGTFSGVYPRVSSGGWQLLGHTETPMWNEHADPPALLQPGDSVQFSPKRNHAIAIPSETAIPQMSVSAESDAQGMDCEGRATCPVEVSGPAPCLEIVRPGLLTTFQDDGRVAANMGVTGSGAADVESFHRANALVGNPVNTPALEITGGGVSMRAHGSVVVALAGAPANVEIVGKWQPQDGRHARIGGNGQFARPYQDGTAFAMQQAMLLRDGDVLSIAPPTSGLRDYLAVRGGFDVEMTLGSASTDTMSGIGPRPIAAKQRLAVRVVQSSYSVGLPQPWPTDLPGSDRVTDLAVRLGPRDDWFTAAGLSALLTQTWTVTAQSNRVGLRLSGNVPLERTDTRELASEATPPGAIEVPTSGQPVIFLRDQPVTGGYPVIAVLEPESLDMAGQLPPGAQVRFHVIASRSTRFSQCVCPPKEVR